MHTRVYSQEDHCPRAALMRYLNSRIQSCYCAPIIWVFAPKNRETERLLLAMGDDRGAPSSVAISRLNFMPVGTQAVIFVGWGNAGPGTRLDRSRTIAAALTGALDRRRPMKTIVGVGDEMIAKATGQHLSCVR